MKGLFGGILLAIGILIAGATGLCTVVVLAGSSPGQILVGLPSVLMFAAIPGVIGVGLIFAGRALIRSERNDLR